MDGLTVAAPARPQPQAVIGADPFGLARRWEYAVLAPGETLAEYFDRACIDVARPVLVRINGARVPRAMWRYTRPRTGQLIEVQAPSRCRLLFVGRRPGQ